MKLAIASALFAVSHAGVFNWKRAGNTFFDQGKPQSADGKGGPILGGSNRELDLQNPNGLGKQSTDSGLVPNLKWSFSLSKARLGNGGWTRTQVKQDLPASNDISAAQQHLVKGGIRELHWHRVAEWGYVFNGSLLVSAVDENGKWEVDKLVPGDIWYFPKGIAHTVQGLEDGNEFLLVFDDNDFDRVGQTFNVDDWIAHVPKDILAKNFGVNESVFKDVPSPFPNFVKGTPSNRTVSGGGGSLTGPASFVYHAKNHPLEKVPGNGGTLRIVDTSTFPASKTIAATVVTLKPGGLRELHWHPNAEEWLYFHKGRARATVFIGNQNHRTFDFQAGDTAVFPDNSGHYIENIGAEELFWIEIYKSDRVKDIPLTQWLALTPSDIVAQVLKIPLEVATGLKKEKQILIEGKSTG